MSSQRDMTLFDAIEDAIEMVPATVQAGVAAAPSAPASEMSPPPYAAAEQDADFNEYVLAVTAPLIEASPGYALTAYEKDVLLAWLRRGIDPETARRHIADYIRSRSRGKRRRSDVFLKCSPIIGVNINKFQRWNGSAECAPERKAAERKNGSPANGGFVPAAKAEPPPPVADFIRGLANRMARAGRPAVSEDTVCDCGSGVFAAAAEKAVTRLRLLAERLTAVDWGEFIAAEMELAAIEDEVSNALLGDAPREWRAALEAEIARRLQSQPAAISPTARRAAQRKALLERLRAAYGVPQLTLLELVPSGASAFPPTV